MYRFISICVAAALAAPVVSFAAEPVWPGGAKKSDDPRVVAFYDGMCAKWADQNGLTGEKRDAYLTKCQADAPAIFPVGYGGGGGGGGGGE
jgi:hypothetical protein